VVENLKCLGLSLATELFNNDIIRDSLIKSYQTSVEIRPSAKAIKSSLTACLSQCLIGRNILGLISCRLRSIDLRFGSSLSEEADNNDDHDYDGEHDEYYNSNSDTDNHIST